MKNNLFLYSLLIFMVIFMAGCATGIPQLPINNNLQGNESDQGNNQDESTGVPRVVFIELFNTDGCAASKAINPIIEEIVAEYENTEVILVEEAGWGKYSTEETSERFKWYFSDKSELHTPSVCFDGLNQLFAEGFSLGGGGNSGNSGNETVEVDTTKPVITGSRDPLPNSFGWNNTDVTVNFSCVDTGSVKSAFKKNTVAGKTLTKEGKNQSVTNTGVLIDMAGNTADPATVSDINIDKTPPVVTITLPGTGEYVLNQSITATWSAADALSGVVAPVSGSVSIDTSSVGTKTFTLPAGTATDKAGNSSLEVTIPYSVIANTEEPVMWSGLGMVLVQTADSNEQYDSWVDTLMANGFTEFRETPNYDSADWLAGSKAAIIRNVGKGAKYIWGVASGVTITSTNWPTFRQAILDAATWAQANGVFEFQLGNEEEVKVDGTTITAAQLITNLKSVATDVQAIFTNGNVSYTCIFTCIDDWITAGKGNIDILASNLYKEIDGNPYDWETDITNMVNAFGGDGTYLTEFSLSNVSLDDYSTDEAVQAAAITEMVDYIKASGMTRAIYFLWYHPTFKMGVVKDDGTYRLLWNSLLGSGQLGGDYMRLTLQEVTGKE
jgi:thiol-disulfide isomerase/thioredoxin